jgi:hypothetical protein
MIFRERKNGGLLNVACAADAHQAAIIRWPERFRQFVRFP